MRWFDPPPKGLKAPRTGGPEETTHAPGISDRTLIPTDSTLSSDTMQPGTVEEAAHFQIGDRLGPYQVVKPLAAGAMGQVYLCEHETDGRRYAVKTVMLSSSDDANMTLERFKREISIGSTISHHNVCRILDSGAADDVHFLVMEYLDGQTLKDCIHSQAPLPLDPTRFILRQVLDGLGAIHSAGAVHRDLKPANIMLIQDGSVKILDLGISRVTGTSSFARTGATLGTPQFISPEQVMDAKRVDHRADLFCVGLMAYQMMSGHLPYEAPRLNLMMHRIATGNQTPLREHRPDLPQQVLDWVELLTRHNPNERFLSAAEATMMLDFL